MPLKKEIKYVGGADVSMNLFTDHGFAGFVTLSYPTLKLVDKAVVKDKINFSYIPGLLAFRIIKRCARAHRLPELTRLAHEAVNQSRRNSI